MHISTSNEIKMLQQEIVSTFPSVVSLHLAERVPRFQSSDRNKRLLSFVERVRDDSVRGTKHDQRERHSGPRSEKNERVWHAPKKEL